MYKGNREQQNTIAEATVKAVFRSAVVAYYVDVQHDWYDCVRHNNNMPQEIAAAGTYSQALEQVVSLMIPREYHASIKLKLSAEYIRNHLNNKNPEFTLELPMNLPNRHKWFRVFVTLIDWEKSLPHHVVISARDITQEHMAQEKSIELISHLQTTADRQKEALAQQNEDLYLQNQELATLNREILASRDAMFQLADDMQAALFQNNMYQEILQLQQAGLIAYDCKTLQLLYMNETALRLYEMTDQNYEGGTIQDLRDKVVILDNTGPVKEMHILRHTGSADTIECSITHSNGRIFYMNIASRNILLENDQNIVVDVVTDVTRRVLAQQELEDKAMKANTRLSSVESTLMHFADYIYHVDLTDAMLLDNFICDGYLKLLEFQQIQAPCKYDEFMQQAIDILGLKVLSYNGRHDVAYNCDTLLQDFYRGINNCELELYHTKTDTYHRITALMSINPEDCHVIMTAIGSDITAIRKKEHEDQQMLLQAQEKAQRVSAQLEEQKSELASKHKSLETAYQELMEFNSIVQGLQSVFSCCYYIDVAGRSFTEIKSNRFMRKHFISSRDLEISMEEYIQQDIKPAYRALVREFVSLFSISSRLSDKPYLTMEYETISQGWIRCYLVPAQYNQNSVPTHILYVNEIIEEEKIIQNHLRKIAETDGLTGIYNRATGEARIIAKLQQKCSGAFGIMDCDDFKGINDNFGHGTGDKVLMMIANSLQEAFGPESIVLRLGGDEFAFFMSGCESKIKLSATVTKFFTIMDAYHIPQLKERKVSVSVGAVLFDGKAARSFEELYELADHNLYESKKIPYNRLTI